MIKSNFSLKSSLAQNKVNQVPKVSVSWQLKNKLRFEYILGMVSVKLAKLLSRTTGIPSLTSKLSLVAIKADGSRVNYGIVGQRVVTTAFVNYLVDQLQTETSDFGDFKFHDTGEGTTAAAIGDTDIETTDGIARVTGTQEEGASANIYKSVATMVYDSTKGITEHGLFNALTGGTLLDRTVFAVVNVVDTESIEFTFEITANSGG